MNEKFAANSELCTALRRIIVARTILTWLRKPVSRPLRDGGNYLIINTFFNGRSLSLLASIYKLKGDAKSGSAYADQVSNIHVQGGDELGTMITVEGSSINEIRDLLSRDKRPAKTPEKPQRSLKPRHKDATIEMQEIPGAFPSFKPPPNEATLRMLDIIDRIPSSEPRNDLELDHETVKRLSECFAQSADLEYSNERVMRHRKTLIYDCQECAREAGQSAFNEA